MLDISQQNRSVILKITGSGDDVMVLVRFEGSEGVNTLFEYRIEALSEDGDIDFNGKIGRNVSVIFKGLDGADRVFDGILTETQWLGVRDDLHAYQLILRPWLWILSRRSDCFIFHNKTVTEIIAEVFKRNPCSQFEDRTIGSYSPIEYCVQYRETDMAFVCRLMEKFGINYFFVYQEGEHKLILCDNNDNFDPAPGGSRPYVPLSGTDRRGGEVLTDWIPARHFTSGRVVYRDYNFKTPTADMEAEYNGTGSYEYAGQELYDYPGVYDKLSEGTPLATVQLQEEEGQDKRCYGTGNCVSLYPGTLMTLTEHRFDYNKEYIVLSCQHSFTAQRYRSGGGSSGETDYEGQFEFLDSSIPLRPPVVTRKAFVQGPQTAVVVGKQGEEIDCDEYGRILVRFFWDRKNDQSMRCRVAQNWAYKQWGGMIIPRIGMEVVVEFLEGDPDRPLVTGCVYNNDNMPPYLLPGNKTRSVFKTHSHKADGYNEIRFEDEAGEEEVWFHAQKYHNAVVGNNETLQVGANRHKSVGASQSESVATDKDIKVGGDHREEIGGEMSLTVGGARIEKIGMNDSTTVGLDQLNRIGTSLMTTVGMDHGLKAGMDQYQEAGMNFHIKAGMSITIEAGLSITLIVGGNYISISPAGISIEGLPMVSVNCSIPAPPPPPPMMIKSPEEPKKYKGPHATRYKRSFQK